MPVFIKSTRSIGQLFCREVARQYRNALIATLSARYLPTSLVRVR
jgi:hypothetical protein